MSLISVRNLDFGIGGPYPLLEHVDLEIEANERVCIVGRNGAGKSTLLKLLAGEMMPDEGRVEDTSGTVIARVPQEVPAGLAGSVFEVVAEPLGAQGARIAEYRRLAEQMNTAADAERLGGIQAAIEAGGGWDVDERVNEVVTRLNLPGAALFNELSGGLKRRVLMARALVSRPQVLLLDEPTNHLDVQAIDWLERFCLDFSGSLVFITHDRRFLRALATRIVEIDRAKVTSWPGDYDNYLRRRAERLNAEEQERERFDKKLAQEERWIRQGVKARRTRNQGRVRELQQMRRERAQRREREGDVRMSAAEAARSGRRVVEAERIRFAYGEQKLVDDFSSAILRGDRVGLVGPNGAGKTTLLHLLIGRLAPQSGRIKFGTNLEIAYFDQQRAQLDNSASAVDNVAGGQEFIEVGGRRKHVMGYLQDFLFTPDRARAPITRLSGGERNRLLLARLFASPSNVLVLDEPTNDLDIETLELLEELLSEYKGTVLLVSHDREFLDNVVTSILVVHGGGRIEESIGGYGDWLARQPVARRASGERQKPSKTPTTPAKAAARPPKLSYREREELNSLPERIECLEERISALTAQLGDPASYQQSDADVPALNQALQDNEAALATAYDRWEALDQRNTSD